MFFTKKYKNLIKENNQMLKMISSHYKENDERFIELNKKYLKVSNHWFWNEYDKTGWEPQTYNTFKEFLTNDTTFVDIGAWVGMTAFYAAELGSKRIYAVEANPLSYELVKFNLSQNNFTMNAQVDQLCITDKDYDTCNFGGNNGANTSSASSMRGNDWQVDTLTLLTYLKNNKILDDKLFVKIDIEGAEGMILDDLNKLSQKDDLTVYLSIHPPFISNKEEIEQELLDICFKYKQVLDSDLQPLTRERLREMFISDEEYPTWGTKFGNFFEITLSNEEFNRG